MYSLGDERAAIREIQKYLLFISDRVTDSVPRVSIDGIYGEETREAVIAFQKYKGVEESGVVDYLTFTLLSEEFKLAKFLYQADNFIIEASHFPIKLGDFGNEALLINLMLDELSEFYDLGRVDVKPYFNSATEDAILNLRRIYMLDGEAVVDALLFDKMRYELLVRAKEN